MKPVVVYACVPHRYNEVKDYSFTDPNSNLNKNIFHFTQLVWKSTTDIVSGRPWQMQQPLARAKAAWFACLKHAVHDGGCHGQHSAPSSLLSSALSWLNSVSPPSSVDCFTQQGPQLNSVVPSMILMPTLPHQLPTAFAAALSAVFCALH